VTAAELAGLLDSWVMHLRAERKSPKTIESYLYGAAPYLTWCDEQGVDPLAKRSLDTHIAGMLDRGAMPSTAKVRFKGVQHFTRWLAAEGEIDADPFASMRPPKVDEPVIPVLTDEQIVDLIAACQPPAASRTGLPSLLFRRDEAIVRLLVETGMRAAECVGMLLDDVDLPERVIVLRGKGGKERSVGFGDKTARALDRYLRVRRLHARAASPELWLGARGFGMVYESMYGALNKRAAAAGIEGMHPHRLRHTSADRWLDAGGSEGGLMAMHGWSSSRMVQRYAKGNRERRAIGEQRRLNLGDIA
jgi:integrase/recombinase XerD